MVQKLYKNWYRSDENIFVLQQCNAEKHICSLNIYVFKI